MKDKKPEKSAQDQKTDAFDELLDAETDPKKRKELVIGRMADLIGDYAQHTFLAVIAHPNDGGAPVLVAGCSRPDRADAHNAMAAFQIIINSPSPNRALATLTRIIGDHMGVDSGVVDEAARAATEKIKAAASEGKVVVVAADVSLN